MVPEAELKETEAGSFEPAKQPLREAQSLFASMGFKRALAETEALLQQVKRRYDVGQVAVVASGCIHTSCCAGPTGDVPNGTVPIGAGAWKYWYSPQKQSKHKRDRSMERRFADRSLL